MRLADFIEANLDELMRDWSAFARQLDLRRTAVSEDALQTSARALLRQLAACLRADPSPLDSRGACASNAGPASGIARQARVHARSRLRAGFTLNEMVSEYCALRANVVSRWAHAMHGVNETACQDLVRFNEALDQALKESIARYSAGLERARDLFVGILAHDLRTPLSAISMSAQLLLQSDDLSEKNLKAAARIHNSSARMQRMIDDLLDFARTRLGNILPLTVARTDLADVCHRAADEIRTAHPEREILVHCTGELTGRWDGNRLAQLLVNLLSNAVHHGYPDRPITLRARRENDGVTVEVHNEGEPIPPRLRRQIFDPLMRGPRPDTRRTGLGLGLYIARQIATAHRGTLGVTSTADGTTFQLWMPCEPPSP